MPLYLIAFVILGLQTTAMGQPVAAPPQTPESSIALAQTRRPPRAAATPADKKPAKDLSKFEHQTDKHKEEKCVDCHKISRATNQPAIKFGDIADYPTHAACLNCHYHREHFFKGARPVICTVCHKTVSPRDDARLEFPKLNRKSQFLGKFPHDQHQDIIASLPHNQAIVEPFSFVRAGLFINESSVAVAADNKKTFNNCEICHLDKGKTDNNAKKWPDGFIPKPDTFRASPDQHSFCFSCHWKAQKPTSDDCKGCHLYPMYPEVPRERMEWPVRKSLKFRHGRTEHIAECTSCHINITRAATLKGLSPDVPIGTCRSCHSDKSKGETSKQLIDEIEAKAKTNKTCVYCHTSEVGRCDPPEGHYRTANKKPPAAPVKPCIQ